MNDGIINDVVERHAQALRLINMHQLQKALLRSAVVELIEEYIAETEHQEGIEYWAKSSVVDHLHDFGLYVETVTD